MWAHGSDARIHGLEVFMEKPHRCIGEGSDPGGLAGDGGVTGGNEEALSPTNGPTKTAAGQQARRPEDGTVRPAPTAGARK